MTFSRNEVPRQSVAHLFASASFVAFASLGWHSSSRGSEDKDESAREKEWRERGDARRDHAEGDERKGTGGGWEGDTSLAGHSPLSWGSARDSSRHYTIAAEAATRSFLGHGRHLGTGLAVVAVRRLWFKISTVKVLRVPLHARARREIRAISLSLIDSYKAIAKRTYIQI